VEHVLRIEQMGSPQGPRKRIFALRSHNKVYMVRHQAVSRYFDAFTLRTLTKTSKILSAVPIPEEDISCRSLPRCVT